MIEASGRVRVRVVGPVQIINSTGEDCTPRGRKACALLVMLALSPDHKRSRVWLQDQLWGTRGKEQGAASLRQSLSEIRRALGHDRCCLRADNFVLSLDPARFEIDLGETPERQQGAELVEGLDIGEEGFEDWLRVQRQTFSERGSQTKVDDRTVR